MASCPNCAHDLSRHMEGRECTARGCSCIIDPKFGATAPGESGEGGVPASRWDFILDQPLSFVAMVTAVPVGLFVLISAAEHAARARGLLISHPRLEHLLRWAENILVVVSLPGILVSNFWVPRFGASKSRETEAVRPGFFLFAGLLLALGLIVVAAFSWFASGR